jgi:hypothetical protein
VPVDHVQHTLNRSADVRRCTMQTSAMCRHMPCALTCTTAGTCCYRVKRVCTATPYTPPDTCLYARTCTCYASMHNCVHALRATARGRASSHWKVCLQMWPEPQSWSHHGMAWCSISCTRTKADRIHIVLFDRTGFCSKLPPTKHTGTLLSSSLLAPCYPIVHADAGVHVNWFLAISQAGVEQMHSHLWLAVGKCLPALQPLQAELHCTAS